MRNNKQFYVNWLKETAAKFKSGEISPETWAYTYLDDEYFLMLGFEPGFDDEPLKGEISEPDGYRLCFSLRKDTGQYFKVDEEFVEDYDYAYVEGDDELTINDVLEVYKNVRRTRKS